MCLKMIVFGEVENGLRSPAATGHLVRLRRHFGPISRP